MLAVRLFLYDLSVDFSPDFAAQTAHHTTDHVVFIGCD